MEWPGAPPDIPSTVYIDDRPVHDIPQGSGEKLHWEPDGRMLEVKVENSPLFRINARTAPPLP
ncbi:MAG TPA: hypothetical protein VHY37_12950 [Tepidisphaeraceae bacterium]|jgi:hypothetical protein|nr:hypothetical protein [Tepidisphaeraceae bacterium]